MRSSLLFLLLLSACFTISIPLHAAPPFKVTVLRCESRINPLGIDASQPRFSWQLQDSRRGSVQSAYQVLVASSEKMLQEHKGDLWDSKKIISAQSQYVAYQGLPLQSGKRYFWKVRSWDKEGVASEWSAPQWYEMGLLQLTDWKADWISMPAAEKLAPAAPEGNWIWHPIESRVWQMIYLRKPFTTAAGKQIKKATLKLSVTQTILVFLNEHKVAEMREWQPSRGQKFFQYDVLPFIKEGTNIISIGANHTKEEQPGVILGLRIEFTDGTTQDLLSDDTWESTAAEQAGWIPEPPANATWVKAKIIEPYGGAIWGKVEPPYESPRSVLMRKEFTLGKQVKQARIYSSGLGAYYLHLNGKPVSPDILAPGWTQYHKRTQYQVYDITQALQPGANAIAAILGNGWWSSDVSFRGMGYHSEGPLRLLLQLHIIYTDGSTEIIKTDESWKAALSPVVFNNMYDGESYDARLEPEGWDKPKAKEQGWKQVVVLNEPKNNMVAEQLQPIRVTEELKPVSIKEISPGRFIFDMGQNMVGWVRLKVKGPAGTKVTLRFAEILHPDGSLKTEPLRTAKATDHYILKGSGEETWEPRFTYHGFQFVEVTGYPGKPTADAILGRVFHTDAPVVGQFASSNSLLNKIQSNIERGLRGNMESVVTDCPQRDERMGWTGDAQIFAATAFYNRDMNMMLRKYMRDIYDSQSPNGRISNVNPNPFLQGEAGPGWGDAMVIVPWRIYQFTGDSQVIAENYPYMKAWHHTLVQRSQNHLLEWGGFGDWVSMEKTPEKPIGSAYYYYSTKLMGQMADVIGKREDANSYLMLADSIAIAFNQTHLDQATKNYWVGTQTANLLPLAFGITPQPLQSEVIKNIADNVIQKDTHLTTGFLGTQYILPMLSDHGYHELAYKLAVQRTMPSWGYMVDQGATTIWELWNSDQAGPDMNSRNHYAYGTVGEWFYKYLGGIGINHAQPGFKQMIIAPKPAGDLSWVKCSYASPYGDIRSNWEKGAGRLTLSVAVPVNTTAEIHVPIAGTTKTITENGTLVYTALGKASGSKDLKLLRVEKDAVVFAAGSGQYQFVVSE